MARYSVHELFEQAIQAVMALPNVNGDQGPQDAGEQAAGAGGRRKAGRGTSQTGWRGVTLHK